MINRVLLAAICFLFLSCGRQKKIDKERDLVAQSRVELKYDTANMTPDQLQRTLDSSYAVFNMIDARLVDSNIMVDLKYATEDNFLKQKLYDRINRAYLQRDVAERLGRSQAYLSTLDPRLHLLVYDALRPISVQRKMWHALDSIPPDRRGQYVSNPLNKSLHNYGAAVDVTICDAKGKPLDMGAGFDDFREIAFPNKEVYYFSKGLLTEKQINNRKLLRKVMRKEGFRNLPTEWWHFNACSRSEVSGKYKFINEEL